ncbi:hypothetical protein SAMN05216553_12515 [Lentzea fradiae]|uniref:Asp23 family, cell envelope-related function n=1 Tax=Lentzea fradiae TaxID=200378 RepID=A0A1G8CX96_9PSEU|nr:hypothetical protein [Lentzea fradiae]SDH50207.1 hypothetical protein SAMN05216553_12515 [Lentzea fradiae]
MVITAELVKALGKVDGLRPSVPEPVRSWVPWDVDLLAVDVADDLVCVRVVATALPLPLAEAGEVLRAVLVGTQWENAVLRIVVTDVDKRALDHLDGA